MKSPEERRIDALATGTKVEYLTCPFCGFNRTLTNRSGETPTFKVNPDHDIIQIRRGGGRGSGFFRSPTEGTKLSDLKDEYPEIFDNLKEEVWKLYDILGGRAVKENFEELLEENRKAKERIKELTDAGGSLLQDVRKSEDKVSKLLDENTKLKDKVRDMLEDNRRLTKALKAEKAAAELPEIKALPPPEEEEE